MALANSQSKALTLSLVTKSNSNYRGSAVDSAERLHNLYKSIQFAFFIVVLFVKNHFQSDMCASH